MFDLTPDALRAVHAHTWPGNVRELENFVQRLVGTSARSEIDAEALAAAHLSLDDVSTLYRRSQRQRRR